MNTKFIPGKLSLFTVILLITGSPLYSQQHKAVDTATIEKIIGIRGKSNKGEYKITVPQNDLNVMVDGFKIVPAMGLGTWVAFTPSVNGVMVGEGTVPSRVTCTGID